MTEDEYIERFYSDESITWTMLVCELYESDPECPVFQQLFAELFE